MQVLPFFFPSFPSLAMYVLPRKHDKGQNWLCCHPELGIVSSGSLSALCPSSSWAVVLGSRGTEAVHVAVSILEVGMKKREVTTAPKEQKFNTGCWRWTKIERRRDCRIKEWDISLSNLTDQWGNGWPMEMLSTKASWKATKDRKGTATMMC